jgi:hypothetical protein
LTSQLALAAVNRAGEETAYPEQIRAGLAAWRVKKVFSLVGEEKAGVVNVTPAQWAERLGRSIAEQAALGRGLLDDEATSGPRNIGLALMVDRLPQGSGRRDIMSGVVLQPGGEARRKLSETPAGDLKQLADAAQKRHNVEQLLARIDTTSSVGAGWLSQIRNLTDGLGTKTAGEVLWQLARKYQQAGKLVQAAEAMEQLVERHPEHPLADAACVWLVQNYASGEVAWRLRNETKLEVRLAAAMPAVERIEGSGFGLQSSGMGEVALAKGVAAGPEIAPQERWGRALKVGKLVEQTRPTVYAEPGLRFALVSAGRQMGQAKGAERWLQTLATSGALGVWSESAAAEQWLLRPSGLAPKKVCSVVAATQKPRLDGRLDDPLWQAAKPVSLRSAGGAAETAAVAAIVYDEKFLYVAVSCPKVAGVAYEVSAGTRVADSDLHERDRITLLLDIDRDYATCWSLTVDHRGWPAESCFGDGTWNPEWFIAAAGDEAYWTIEAAIPLTELAPARPKAGDAWAVGLQRVIPRVALQSFTTPAAVEALPEGMGLLVFE